MVKETELKAPNTVCFHCGEVCNDGILSDDKMFCCAGCRTVYEILANNSLCEYYNFNSHPGTSFKQSKSRKELDFLDDKNIAKTLIEFSEGYIETVSFLIPSIHCSSCIWLLENLHTLEEGIISSTVNFLNKTVRIKYSTASTSLRKTAELLCDIGYEPEINHEKTESSVNENNNKKLYYRLGVAGFCFSNIMLLSFPEYLSGEGAFDSHFKMLFGTLNILLALPVVLYSASDYYVSAVKAVKHKMITLDLPIFFGISVIFIRSVYEVLSATGTGYFDSLTGLIFFLLIGRIFQNKTYTTLNFERKYKSYFPLAVKVKKNGKVKNILISELEPGDRIIVKNNEIIPADAYLFNGSAEIDYSFVTGESKPVTKVLGEVIYAGGRQIGSEIELEVFRKVSQSYLTGLWNNETFNKDKGSIYERLSDSVAKYFILFILIASVFTLTYWYLADPSKAFNAFISVLIVACPCALALALPFTLGNIMRVFGKNDMYVKNTNVIEKLSAIDTIVLDKTGTITKPGANDLQYYGTSLTGEELSEIKSLTSCSGHPYSVSISEHINKPPYCKVENFKEVTGKGISGAINRKVIKIGSALFVNALSVSHNDKSSVYISINNELKGYYLIGNAYRDGIKELITSLKKNYSLYVLSGDNESEKEKLAEIFGTADNIYFKQAPEDKLKFIKLLKAQGKKVLMLGDGLNDAGALKESMAGIAVSENINNFFPSSDALLGAGSLSKLGKYLRVSQKGMKIVLFSFLVSFVYNAAGLGIAFSGSLSPLIAAVLMPLSSITVVMLSVGLLNRILKSEGLL